MSSLRQGVRSWPSLGDWTCLYFSVSIYKKRIRPFLAAPQGDYKRVEAQAPPPPNTHTSELSRDLGLGVGRTSKGKTCPCTLHHHTQGHHPCIHPLRPLWLFPPTPCATSSVTCLMTGPRTLPEPSPYLLQRLM